LKEGKSEECLTETDIDMVALETCKESADEEFKITENLEDKSKWSGGRFPAFLIYDEENKKYGVRGSPTLVINGFTVSSGRDSASLLSIVCSAFNEPPEECSTELSNATPSPGFGFEETGTDSSGTC